MTCCITVVGVYACTHVHVVVEPQLTAGFRISLV